MQSDPELGFVLHPLDGATNKVLALAGRGEVRDYLDVLFLHQNVPQPSWRDQIKAEITEEFL